MTRTTIRSEDITAGQVKSADLASDAVDTTSLRNDISTLALHSAIADNKAAYNLSNAFIDQFEDDTGIDTETNCDRVSSEYITTVIPAQGNDNNTKLLISSNTTNGSTTFTDSSVGGSTHTITATGDVNHSTAQQKFGTSSIYFDGTGDYLRLSDPGWNWESSWTVDFWIRFSSLSGTRTIWSQNSNTGGGSGKIRSYIHNSGNNLLLNHWGSSNESIEATGLGLSTNTWYHFEYVQSGSSNFYLFVDGNLEASGTWSSTSCNPSHYFEIGREDYESGNYINAYIDEFRVSVGTARHTASFTTSTSAYAAENINATGNFTSASQTAQSSVSTMGAVILYKNNAGTATLNTDLVCQLSADGGSNYTTATLEAGGTFSTGISIAKVNGLTIGTPGTAPKYKISFANQASGTKETQVHGVAMLY